MACRKCGAKRGHLPGCDDWAAPIKRRQKADEGKEKKPPLPKWKKCGTCGGDGYRLVPARLGGTKRIQCGECRGYGRIGD